MMNTNYNLEERFYISILIFIIPILAIGQNEININLFLSKQIVFQDIIKETKIGTETLQVDLEKKDNIISILSKVPLNTFKKTNLYVVTKKGYHYNFLLNYSDNQEDLLKPTEIKLEDAYIKPENYSSTTDNNLTTDSETQIVHKLLVENRKLRRFFSRFDDIYLQLINHYYIDDYVYYKVLIENNSTIDYVLDYIKFFIETKGKRSKKSNSQKLLELNKDYFLIYGKSKVEPNELNYLIFKFNKFSLNKEQNLLIDMKEKNGNRDLDLKLNSRLINNPLILK